VGAGSVCAGVAIEVSDAGDAEGEESLRCDSVVVPVVNLADCDEEPRAFQSVDIEPGREFLRALLHSLDECFSHLLALLPKRFVPVKELVGIWEEFDGVEVADFPNFRLVSLPQPHHQCCHGPPQKTRLR
jgi:hypothetical protein